MKFYILMLIFLLLSCKTSPPQSHGDQFDKILQVMKLDDPAKIKNILGSPNRVESTDPKFDLYFYEKNQNQMPMKIFIDRKSNKVFSLALTYWVNFDAYAFLKNRFKNFKWNEVPLKSKAIDVVEEKYKVQIPELGMTFEYDNQDPLRRPMWIFFK